MLDVERREHIDAGSQELVDVLPAFRMPRPWRISVSEFVDKDQRGASRKRSVEVEFLDRCTLDLEHERWQLLEFLEKRRRFYTAMRFEDPYDHVGTRAT